MSHTHTHTPCNTRSLNGARASHTVDGIHAPVKLGQTQASDIVVGSRGPTPIVPRSELGHDLNNRLHTQPHNDPFGATSPPRLCMGSRRAMLMMSPNHATRHALQIMGGHIEWHSGAHANQAPELPQANGTNKQNPNHKKKKTLAAWPLACTAPYMHHTSGACRRPTRSATRAASGKEVLQKGKVSYGGWQARVSYVTVVAGTVWARAVAARPTTKNAEATAERMTRLRKKTAHTKLHLNNTTTQKSRRLGMPTSLRLSHTQTPTTLSECAASLGQATAKAWCAHYAVPTSCSLCAPLHAVACFEPVYAASARGGAFTWSP
jgi:hypothetical protein